LAEGWSGGSLALELADTGRSTLLIEGTRRIQRSQPSFDDRTTALAMPADGSLKRWGLVAHRSRSRRHSAHSRFDAGRFGFARLRAQEQGSRRSGT